MKILNVVGARPNFMKIAPIMAELEKQGELKGVLIHTGQHYDKVLAEQSPPENNDDKNNKKKKSQ